MKRSYIFIVIFLLFFCSCNKKKLYEEKMEDLQHKLEFGRYNVLIDYFKDDGRFPNSLMEIYLASKGSSSSIDAWFIEQHYYIDVFSKNGKWIGYYPIYNSDDSEIISYILLSAGIDGKLDNVLAPSDKLHLSDWKEKLKLYNPDEFDKCERDIEERPFSAREERSGKKDLLIRVYHCCTE